MPTEAQEQTPERGHSVGDRYILERPVSSGAHVWLASDPSGAQLALKTGHSAAIEHEYRVLRSLSHPNVVRVVDRFDVGGEAWLALEYLAGGDLVSLAGEDSAHWLGAIADVIATLGYLHTEGLVHRDLKARNVMFDAAGRVRLIDFGSLAQVGEKWTMGGTTLEAIDPVRGSAPVDVADDVYALAALLHELLYGMLPGGDRPVTRGASPILEQLLVDCLDRRPGDTIPALSRFATVIESLLEVEWSQVP